MQSRGKLDKRFPKQASRFASLLTPAHTRQSPRFSFQNAKSWGQIEAHKKLTQWQAFAKRSIQIRRFTNSHSYSTIIPFQFKNLQSWGQIRGPQEDVWHSSVYIVNKHPHLQVYLSPAHTQNTSQFSSKTWNWDEILRARKPIRRLHQHVFAKTIIQICNCATNQV